MMGLAGFMLLVFGVVSLFSEDIMTDYHWALAFGCILLGAALTVVNRLTGGDDD